MSTKYFLLMAFFTMSWFSIRAQKYFTPGIIITNQNDTLRGEIKGKGNFHVLFKNTSTREITSFSANDLRLYEANGFQRISQEIEYNQNKKRYFMKVRLLGRLSLYELVTKEGDWEYVLRNQKGEFLPLVGQDAYRVLTLHMGDCQDDLLSAMMAARDFIYSYGYFEKVLRRYNNCMNKQEPIVIRNSYRGSFEIIAGIARNGWSYTFRSNFYAKPSMDGPLETYHFVPFGISYTIMPHKRLSGVVELMYNKYFGYRRYQIVSTAGSKNESISALEEYIMFSAMPRIVLSDKNVRTYLKAGPTFSYPLRFGIKVNYASLIVKDAGHQKGPGAGYSIGMGLEKYISKSKAVNMELRYHWHSIQDRATNIGTSNGIFLLTSFSFR
jgi:hypothetical protein